MPLKCDDNNWFTGSFSDIQVLNAELPVAAMIAMQIAQMIAAGKALTKIVNLYAMPCPVGCGGKTGQYSLDVNFEFKNSPRGMSVECKVAWLLLIECDPDRQTQPAPVLQEWRKLHHQYGESAK